MAWSSLSPAHLMDVEATMPPSDITATSVVPPSLSGRYATISPGVRPIISLASAPTARILLSISEMATTDGSLMMTPRPGTNTSVLAVPRSIPSLGEKKAMWSHDTPPSNLGQIYFLSGFGFISHQNFLEKSFDWSHTLFK